jgi:hypothetical protein
MKDLPDSIGARAFLRDKNGNVYEGDQLFLALMMKTKMKSRSKKEEELIGNLLDAGDKFK